MKYLLLFLFALSGLFATAQDTTAHDYSQDTMHLSLKVWKFAMLAQLDQAKGSPESQAYVRRVAKRWDGVDSNAVVKITTTYGQFLRAYTNQLYQSDGIAAEFNNELLTDLTPYMMRHPWLLQQVMQLRQSFAQRRVENINAGIELIRNIKKTTLLDD